MASNPKLSFVPEIGPDGIAKESPAIAYAEKIIEEEQLQLKRYIQENYSKIRDVEKELENLTFELKLTAGPKRAALEHLRKKIEVVNEKICAAKLKEEQTKKAWEAAAQVVKDEEAVKQELCDDLNQLVQESAHTQHSRLEELRRRLEALNPSRVSSDVSQTRNNTTDSLKAMQQATNDSSGQQVPLSSGIFDGNNQQKEAQMTGKKRIMNPPKMKNIVLKSRAGESGWTGAGFDVDGRT